jgi:hypothetical protein
MARGLSWSSFDQTAVLPPVGNSESRGNSSGELADAITAHKQSCSNLRAISEATETEGHALSLRLVRNADRRKSLAAIQSLIVEEFSASGAISEWKLSLAGEGSSDSAEMITNATNWAAAARFLQETLYRHRLTMEACHLVRVWDGSREHLFLAVLCPEKRIVAKDGSFNFDKIREEFAEKFDVQLSLHLKCASPNARGTAANSEFSKAFESLVVSRAVAERAVRELPIFRRFEGLYFQSSDSEGAHYLEDVVTGVPVARRDGPTADVFIGIPLEVFDSPGFRTNEALPSFVFSARIGPNGAVFKPKVQLGIVKNHRCLDPDTVDTMIREGLPRARPEDGAILCFSAAMTRLHNARKKQEGLAQNAGGRSAAKMIEDAMFLKSAIIRAWRNKVQDATLRPRLIVERPVVPTTDEALDFMEKYRIKDIFDSSQVNEVIQRLREQGEDVKKFTDERKEYCVTELVVVTENEECGPKDRIKLKSRQGWWAQINNLTVFAALAGFRELEKEVIQACVRDKGDNVKFSQAWQKVEEYKAQLLRSMNYRTSRKSP